MSGTQALIRYRLGPHGGECRRTGCHREVLWLRDPLAQTRVAVDPRPVPDGPVTVDLGRGTVRWLGPGDVPTEDGTYMPHELTCAHANPARSDRQAPSRPEPAGAPACAQPVADLFDQTERPCALPFGHTQLCAP